MGIFSKFFEQKRKSSDPELQFGRYTDTYKTDDKYKIWDIAIEHFENEKYLVSYTHFLDFLNQIRIRISVIQQKMVKFSSQSIRDQNS
jgi:hypothetical protein